MKQASKKLINPNIINQVPPDYYQEGVNKNILQKIWHTEKIKQFKKIINQGSFNTVLDIGSNSGFMTNKIQEEMPGAKVYAVDCYEEAVKLGRNLYPNIIFKKASAEKLPFSSNIFDLVVSYETIEHVENPQKMLMEIKRVSKKDSTIILAMDSGSIIFKTIWFFWTKTKGRVWDGAHLHPPKTTELKQLILSFNFTVIKTIYTHMGMEVVFIFKKK